MNDSDVCLSSEINLDDLNRTPSHTMTIDIQKDVAAGLRWRHGKLSSAFSKWRLYIKQQRKTEVVEIRALKLMYLWICRKNFQTWRNRLHNQQRLQALGEKLRLTKHFKLWSFVLDKGLSQRKTFLRFLLIRRSIYERRFLAIWRGVYHLKMKLNTVAKQANAHLMTKALQVFSLLVNRRRETQALISNVVAKHAFYHMKRGFQKWRMSLRYKRLSTELLQRKNYRQLCNRFIFWRSMLIQTEVRQEKRDAIAQITRTLLLRAKFNHWYHNFYKKSKLRHSEAETMKTIQRRHLSVHFSRWISKFRTQEHLQECATNTRNQRAIFILTRSFWKWHDMYSSLRKKYEIASGSAATYNAQRLTRFFEKWKRKARQSRFDRRLTQRATRKLNFFRMRRSFGIWEYYFNIHRENRLSNAKAQKFRALSLKVKAFCSWKDWARNRQAKKSAEEDAIEHYVFRLQQNAMRQWKILHVKTIRRYVMITSVLKAWANRLQIRILREWRRYNEQKKLMRFYTQKSFELYHQRRMSYTLAAFVTAARQIPFIPQSNCNWETSTSDTNCDTVTVTKLTRNKLTKPKRPTFLLLRSHTDM